MFYFEKIKNSLDEMEKIIQEHPGIYSTDALVYQVQKTSGISERHVIKRLALLERMKVIVKDADGFFVWK